jgi:hypothetical protein
MNYSQARNSSHSRSSLIFASGVISQLINDDFLDLIKSSHVFHPPCNRQSADFAEVVVWIDFAILASMANLNNVVFQTLPAFL